MLDAAAGFVRVFDTSGTPVTILPAAGQTAVDTPTALGVDPVNQRLWISDYGPFDPDNTSTGFGGDRDAFVHEYDYAGIYKRTLSGDFSRPQGLAVVANELYLVDCVLAQVLVFDRSTLALKETIGTRGTDPGQLLLPLDLAIDTGSGDLYVTNNQAGRIELFKGVVP